MFGKRKPDSPNAGDSGSSSETARTGARPSSKPDVSAVLERQPQPPVRPGGGYAAPAPSAPKKAEPVSTTTDDGEMKKLIVGRDIRLAGEITACDKLVVEGQVEADLADAQMLEIAESGLFKGRAEVDVAEVSGTFDGELTVRERLVLRATGQVKGTLRYAELEIERGGRVNGAIEEIGPNSGTAGRPASVEAPAPAPVASSEEESEPAKAASSAAN
jgi:cytoskeletal protein CcmA (bactofilin family)